MKCVQFPHTGAVKRLTDEEAEKEVAAGARYVSKTTWRDYRDKEETNGLPVHN